MDKKDFYKVGLSRKEAFIVFLAAEETDLSLLPKPITKAELQLMELCEETVRKFKEKVMDVEDTDEAHIVNETEEEVADGEEIQEDTAVKKATARKRGTKRKTAAGGIGK